MGYFLASMRLSRTLTGRLFYFSAAVIIPVIFHGTFDYLLILGNISTYVIPVLLVCLIIITEYLLAKSQIIPSIKYFSEMNIGLEDWKTIKMEPQFDRWILRSMGTPNVNAVPFFSLHLSTVKIILIVTALILSIFSFLLPQTVSKIAVTLSRHEFMMLFVFLPALYGFNIFIVGIINPKYFENSIIRIPIIIDTVFSFDADVQKEDDVVDTVTYHITPSNSYFKTPRSFQPGTSVKCILFCARFSSPVIKGVVSYDTHNDAAKFNGTLLRFTSRPAGFWLFFLRYNIYRLLRGITFNLHLPGSKIIRELFVRPVSVMQDKECCNAGHVVFKQGEPGRKFYYVHSGKVDIVKTFKSGKQTRLTTLTRGDIFGEMSLVGNQPRLATAVCRTDCVLAVADSDNLDALIRSNPEFARKLIENFAGHCYQTDVLSGQNITDITRSKNKDIKFLLSLIRVILKVEKDHSTIENLTNGLCDKLKCDHDKIIKMITRIEEVNASTDILAGIDKDTYSAVIKRRD